MWQYNYSQPHDELMHYGKKGMKWGKRSGPRRTEADTARSLAKAYTNSMDKRSAKRPGSLNRKQEAKTANKLADKYTNAMDKKEAKNDFKKEVKIANKKGLLIETNAGKMRVNHNVTKMNKDLKITQAYNSKGVKIGKDEAERILNSSGTKTGIKTLAATGAIAVGGAAVLALLK